MTTRLALAGVASALLPFVVGALVVTVVPDRVVTRRVDADLSHAASLGAARLQERRADLAVALASVDQRELRNFALAGNETALRSKVRTAWRATTGDDQSRVEVALRSAAPQRAHDGAVATYTVLRAGATTIGIMARERGADERILRATTHDTGIALAIDADERANSHRAGERHVTATVDAARGVAVRAHMSGSPAQLLVRTRGHELLSALLLLLVAGVLGAVAIALVMNRMLRRIATSAERMAGGDFDVRLPVEGSDAGARVTSSLNNLAAELQARIGALERSIDQLDRTLEGIEDGVCAWSPDGAITTWNSAASALLEVDPRTAPQAATHTVEALALERAPGRRRTLVPVADGARSVMVELFARRMGDGGVLQVFRDATPALAIEQARKNFLVTAAHQLRTPLTSILGFSATLADETLELAPDVRRTALQHVLREAEHLDSVVDSLFESSLLARDKLAVNIEQVAVADVVADAAQLACVADVDVAGIADGAVVRADRRALVRVLASLLDNADKYGAPPIEVVTRRDDRRVCIDVCDHGGGIATEAHEAVFEPFYRIDPDMLSDVGGAGMGLYTARRLVEAMGGSLSMGSDDEPSATGAVLTIVLATPDDA